MTESTRITGVRVCSFAHMHGKAKTPPHKPYDMRRVFYLVPARGINKVGEGSEYNRVAFGYEIKEAECIQDDALLDDFRNITYLEPVDLFVAPHPDDFTRMVIVGVEQKVQLVAAPMSSSDSPSKKDKF